MYTTPQSGQTTVAAVAPTLHVGTYRRALLAVVIGSPLFTDAEQVLTNHNAHECQDAARLALWTRNVRRIADERQAQRNAATLANMEQGIARFNARVAAAEQAKAQAPAEQPTAALVPTTPAPAVPAAPTAPARPATAPPAWVVLHGRITRAQRQELERRLLPQTATSYYARTVLENASQWTAARATAALLGMGVQNVADGVARGLRFSLGRHFAPGLLPRRQYAAFKCLRRVVLPTHRDYLFAQPGERFDYCIAQN